MKNRAYSYEKENNTYIKNLNSSNAGATSLLTTVEDLAKWTLNFEHPVVGDADLIGTVQCAFSAGQRATRGLRRNRR
ncbi:MAG: hypothetical protein QM757_06890 [Paludibaculum sp.]